MTSLTYFSTDTEVLRITCRVFSDVNLPIKLSKIYRQKK
nr:MAG TPA: hypothetical protein [Caudoviricetes sp.]